MYKKFFKRFFDFVLSLLAIILLSPAYIILGILTCITHKGKIIFTQERPTKNKRIFKIYKFVTMTDKKDENGKLLPETERVTKFGKFMRKLSLDELPELINILKGDMSFVGPRPLLPKYLPYYTEREDMRHGVRGGLTGLAQVNGRNFLSWEERFNLDVYYVEHLSLWLDIKIIFKTIGCVFKRKNVAVKGSYSLKDLDEERRDKV